MPIGSQVKLEVLLENQTIQLEGTVAHANSAATQIRSLKVSGMGVTGDFDALQKYEVIGEQRVAPRIFLDAEVEIFFGSEKRSLTIQDLSTSGAALVSSSDLPPIAFARVNLKLTPDSPPITLDGVPIRTEKKDDVTILALQFLDPPALFVAQLEALIHALPQA